LTLEARIADYFEEVARTSDNPKAAANFILNDLLREQKQAMREEGRIPLPAAHLAELIRLIDVGTVSGSMARQELFPEMYRSGSAPEEIVRSRGLEQLSDDATLRTMIREVLASHPVQLEQYRAGKTGLLGFFVGQVMRRSGGKANPQRVGQLLEEEAG
jgi:aspartyl-tRNA(Asn)/glutamyl-tRNA(Gln) amidotransferase subunit B